MQALFTVGTTKMTGRDRVCGFAYSRRLGSQSCGGIFISIYSMWNLPQAASKAVVLCEACHTDKNIVLDREIEIADKFIRMSCTC